MRPVARLVQLELGATGDHFFTEFDECVDNVAQRQDLWPPATDGEHVGREIGLRRAVPPNLVQHDFRGGIFFQFDDDAHTLAAGFVTDVGDALDPLVLCRFSELFNQPGFTHLIRNCGQDNRAAVAFAFLDFMAGTHHDRAAPFAIRITRAALAED